MIRRRVLLSLRHRAPSHLRSNSAISPLPSPNSSASSFSTVADPSPNRSSLFGLNYRISFGFGNRIIGDRFVYGVREFATRMSDNRPPKETILLDGCDFEHWLVVVEKPDPELTRDEIIDSYIKTLAQVVGSVEEARMKIYSVSTKHYFAFGALVSEELSYKLKELPNVRWVLPDSYLDVPNKTYGGEPFIDGQAVPYDPKYHELWVRNYQNSLRNNEKNRNKQRGNTRTMNRGPPHSEQCSAVNYSQAQNQTSQPSQVQTPTPHFQLSPRPSHSPVHSSNYQNQVPHQSESQGHQAPPPHFQPSRPSHTAQTPVPATNYENQAPRPLEMQDRLHHPHAPLPPSRPAHGAADRTIPPSGYQNLSPNPSQFQNQAVPHGALGSTTHSANARMPPMGYPNEIQESSPMQNRAPWHPTSAASTHGNLTWNSQSPNSLPSSSAYPNQGLASNSNLSNWNTTSGGYPPTQNGQNIHNAGYAAGNQNQQGQPFASQALFQSQRPTSPPFHRGMPPTQQQNDFIPRNMPQPTQNTSYQNHGAQGSERDHTRSLNMSPSPRIWNEHHDFKGPPQYAPNNEFLRREMHGQVQQSNEFQFRNRGPPNAPQVEYQHHGQGNGVHEDLRGGD